MALTSQHLEGMVEKMLKGEGLEVTEFHSLPEHMDVVSRRNVCLSVCAVIFNSKGEVLMVQETKRECYGSWYLPAGRIEEGETIVEALQREVREEAGIDCQPITLLQIQEEGPKWIRFTFLAEKTGGSLKLPEQEDAESLQAQWWDFAGGDIPSTLRKDDIVSLIDAGIKYRQNPPFSTLQPVNLPCDVVCQRILLTFISSDGNTEDGDEDRLWLLLSNRKDNDAGSHLQLPVAVSVQAQTITFTANRLVHECMPLVYNQLSVNTCGILGVQHNGKLLSKADGVCFNTLVLLEYAEEEEGIDLSSPPKSESDCYIWHEVTNHSLRAEILQRIREGSVLPVHNLD
ncbi:8-oxo-dGDP phosphatase NUDT18 isoform X4 [Myxocyprinus asiaticus]|uniref:8-oxo-dGDP phosphatase NUDT18 isoform X4 n=1 Tax=Myxocyprinus asiaticus TaxID=70543 RepID=UPI0022235B87|nr:8-oxo-dGDP phosphatase NUDT18 isoform X4 [Myxocyprinus asiaticus]